MLPPYLFIKDSRLGKFFERRFRTLKRFFSSLTAKTDYSFSLKEKFLGAKVCEEGYNFFTREKVSRYNDELLLASLDEKTILVAPKAFQPDELTYLYHEIYEDASKNPHSYKNEGIKVDKGDVVLDVGACEGFFSMYAMEHGASRVYAFEPVSALKNSLNQTFELLNYKDAVSVVPKGLYDKTGTFNFSSDEQYVAMSQIDEQGSDTLDTITLDDFMQEYAPASIDFIKMDIEGAEVKSVLGAKNVVKTFRPKWSIAVYHAYENAAEIKKILHSYDPTYKITYGGCYMREKPLRPYMLYAY